VLIYTTCSKLSHCVARFLNIIACFFCVDDNVVHREGTLIEVPEPDMNMELRLCISFESNTSSDQIVVLAHHTDNPTKLSAYYSPDNCLRPPNAGSYIFAVFTHNSDNTLKPLATPPEVFIHSMSTCKYSCFDPALLIPNLPTLITLHGSNREPYIL